MKAAGLTIAPYWSTVFGSNMADKDVMDMLAAPGVGAAAPAAASERGAAAGSAARRHRHGHSRHCRRGAGKDG